MFNQNRNKKEYFSLRKFKGVGLASALVGLAILGSGSVSAEEITTGVTRDGGVTTITADGATAKFKDSHVTIVDNEQDGYNLPDFTSQSFQVLNKTVTAEKEKRVLAEEESNFKDETTENHALIGDVTVDYKTTDDETVKESSKVAVNTLDGVATEKEVTSVVRGDFGRVIKGGSLDNEFSEVDSNSLKQGVETSTTVSPVKLTKGKVTYHKIDTQVDTNKLEYFKNVEMNDVHEDLTTHLLHNEDGSVKYSNIQTGSKIWVVEELEDGSYGKFTTITKTDTTDNDSVISDFKNALPTAQNFTDVNVKAAGGIQKPDYLLVLERNKFARIEKITTGGITGTFIAQDVTSNPNTLVPNSSLADYVKSQLFQGFISKQDALKKIAELKKTPKFEAKDSEGRPTKNLTLGINGTTSTEGDASSYLEDTVGLESAITNSDSKFYNVYDAINGLGAYKGTPIPFVAERELTGANKDLTVDYIWNHSTDKPATLTPELRASLEAEIAKVNEHKANQTSAVYETEVPEGVKFERIVVQFVSDTDNFTWKQINGVPTLYVQDSDGNDHEGSGIYGEYTVNGQKHRVRISNMKPFSVKRTLSGLFNTEYNDIFMVNRAYKKVDSSAHVTNIYAKEQSETTENRGTTIVKYVDEEGNTLREDVTGPDGVVSTRVVKFYLDKDGQRQVVSDETTPTNNIYDVSTEQYKPTSLEKDGKVYGYVRTDGVETGKLIEGNTVITYVYKMKKAPLNVNYYLENTTTPLAPSETQADLPVKSDYTTQAKDIPSKTEVQDLPEKTVTTVTTYELVATPDNANGKIAEGGTTVNYFYRAVEKVTEVAKQAPVTVNYYKEGTTEKLADTIEQGQKDIGSNYTTESKTIPDKVEVQDLEDRVITKTTSYELVSEPTDKEGKVPVGGKVVNYFYREVVNTETVMKKAPVVANYYIEGTTIELAASDNQGDQNIGSDYTTSTKVIEPRTVVENEDGLTVTRTVSYELVETPADKEGKVPVGGKIVNYYYREVVKEVAKPNEAPKVEVPEYNEPIGTVPNDAPKVEVPEYNEPIGTVPNEAPKVEVPEYNEPIGTVPNEAPKVEVPEYNEPIGIVPNDAPIVDIPEYNEPIGIVPNDAPIVDIPEYNEPIGTVPNDAPKVDIPEYNEPIGTVPNDAPKVDIPEYNEPIGKPGIPEIHEKPELVIPEVPTKPVEPSKSVPVENNAPVKENMLPNTGGGDSSILSLLGGLSLTTLLGFVSRKRKED